MDTRGNDKLREMLAAEYALGTLRGPARRRFERWARNDPELRALAMAWSERLLPFVDSVSPVRPPTRVWEAIEARLPGFTARHGRAESEGWWDRIGLWRGFSAAFAAVAVVAIGLAMRPPAGPLPTPPPPVVQVVPTAIATLVDPKSGKPVAVVLESGRGEALTVKVAADVEVPEGKALQLWMKPNDSDALVSMGVLPLTARSGPARVTTADAATLLRVGAFGLSLEPAGGSPQPTQVLGLGAVVRL